MFEVPQIISVFFKMRLERKTFGNHWVKWLFRTSDLCLLHPSSKSTNNIFSPPAVQFWNSSAIVCFSVLVFNTLVGQWWLCFILRIATLFWCQACSWNNILTTDTRYAIQQKRVLLVNCSVCANCDVSISQPFQHYGTAGLYQGEKIVVKADKRHHSHKENNIKSKVHEQEVLIRCSVQATFAIGLNSGHVGNKRC